MHNLIISVFKILNSNIGEEEKLQQLKELLLNNSDVKRILDFENRELKGIKDIKENGFVDEDRTVEEILKR